MNVDSEDSLDIVAYARGFREGMEYALAETHREGHFTPSNKTAHISFDRDGFIGHARENADKFVSRSSLKASEKGASVNLSFDTSQFWSYMRSKITDYVTLEVE